MQLCLQKVTENGDYMIKINPRFSLASQRTLLYFSSLTLTLKNRLLFSLPKISCPYFYNVESEQRRKSMKLESHWNEKGQEYATSTPIRKKLWSAERYYGRNGEKGGASVRGTGNSETAKGTTY